MKFINQAFDQFVKEESSSSILLLAVTVLTLILVNTGLYEPYHQLLNSKLTIGISNFALSKSLILWINDGLMAIFFFVIGLEIKREILIGELSSIKKASLPVIAAIGGMLFPILIFKAFVSTPETAPGWAIPMATDIAFTLGILNLLGKKVPYGLKVFLTAFAIVDDLGAILVIAIFYSGSIHWTYIIIAIILFLILLLINKFRLYNKYLFTLIAIIIWILFLKSGIHATLAGVLVAFAVPISKKIRFKHFEEEMTESLSYFKLLASKVKPRYLLTHDQMGAVHKMEMLTDKIKSPLQSTEHRLHGWVSYLIMPIFAFANAGVLINTASFQHFHLSSLIAISLIAGNFIGITLFCFIAVKTKLANLPANTTFRQLSITGLLGGVGFTMSLFITNLSFSQSILIDASKIGILIGSLIAGVGGYFLLKTTLKSH